MKPGLAVVLLACALSVAGADPEPEDSAVGIAELGWLAGSWAGESDGVAMEEHWTVPAGGMMLGIHRDVPPGGKVFFEYLRIEQTPEGILYMASPLGRSPATPFRLVALEGRRAIFENAEHDFPQRIVYLLDDDGKTLHARVEGEQGGRAVASEWTWTRQPGS